MLAQRVSDSSGVSSITASRAALVAATAAPLAALHPRVVDWVVSDDTSYCLVYRTTGMLCPLCGMTHAVIDFVHGSFVDATRANLLVWLYFAVILVGWLAVLGARPPAWNGLEAPRRILQSNFAWLLLGTLTVFTVARNLT